MRCPEQWGWGRPGRTEPQKKKRKNTRQGWRTKTTTLHRVTLHPKPWQGTTKGHRRASSALHGGYTLRAVEGGGARVRVGGGGECDSDGEKWQLHENKGRRTRKPTHSATPRDRHTTRKGTTPAPYRLLQAGEGALCVVMGCPDHERWGPTWGADLGVAARAPRSPSMSFSRAVRIGPLGTAVPCFPPKTPPKNPPP